MAIESVELTPHIGSQVMISKEDLLDGGLRDEIRQLLVVRGAIVIRGLNLNDPTARCSTKATAG